MDIGAIGGERGFRFRCYSHPAYFAHAVRTSYYIKKVPMGPGGCTNSPTTFGPNWYSGSSRWGAQVGMCVDPVTGDLYVAAATTGGGAIDSIYKIDSDQNVSLVKSGTPFTTINGLDIVREGPAGSADPGFLLVADNGVSTVYAFALDNTSVAPITVRSATALRTVVGGESVFGGDLDPAAPANVIRNVEVHNDDTVTALGRIAPVRPDPMTIITPSCDPQLWISSPSPVTVAPTGQGEVRPSYPPTSVYSTGRVELRWKDGKDRQVCAWTGDPGPAETGYEPAPGTPVNCDVPFAMAGGSCDNQDPVNPPGTFTDTNDVKSCKTCGGTAPCVWDFRITQRYAGDNWRVYFTEDTTPWKDFTNCSGAFTAWKRAYIEKDNMYRRGGLLFDDYIPGAWYIIVYSWADISAGNSIEVFDERSLCTDTATVDPTWVPSPQPDGSLAVPFTGALSPTSTYLASDKDLTTPRHPTFTNGHSGGAGVTGSGFYEADMGNIWMPFDDALVSFWDRPDGRSSLPYMGAAMFDDLAPPETERFARLSQIWFTNFLSAGGTPPTNEPHNYFHLLGVSNSTKRGGTSHQDFDFTYVFVDATPQATLRAVLAHELAHLFYVNACAHLPNICDPDCDKSGHDPCDWGQHDYRGWWLYPSFGGCPNPDACLMDPGGLFGAPKLSGIDRFCEEDLLLGDPDAPCMEYPDKKETAIRTGSDPR